jgi:hypothetical protein
MSHKNHHRTGSGQQCEAAEPEPPILALHLLQATFLAPLQAPAMRL